MASFPDHFSAVADRYARFRPTYPPALFDFLAGLCLRRGRAWDCATGNGQAAVALAERFAEVVATDASADQVAHARPHERVRYGVRPAEASGLEAGSVDLVTVAQALHWFDLPAFFAEADRVLRPGGVLAVWTYNRVLVGPAVDAVVGHFYREVVGPYWPFERALVEGGYTGVAFPFEPVEAPDFHAEAVWSLEDFVGYLGTWSAVQRYRAERGEDPVALVRADLTGAWGEGERMVRWPLPLHVRRKPA